ncbi:HAD family hydrolase [Bacillus coahuilensis]|uniref:HAD family hydrolase n=1 Tax=Bacillus coahuilensis TaxID=408580 RepID=UPI0007500A64|nr:HAD family hydrolase [Bacillus coahuilensis]
MILFASDLDRTLIYSKRMLELYPSSASVRLIESLNGKDISYMTEKAIERLKDFHSKALFVPVTTRTEEQFKRISLFQKEIEPTYSITTNGAKILYKGLEMKDWTKMIEEQLMDCASIEMVEHYILQLNAPWLKKVNRAENRFLYCIIERDLLDTTSKQEIEKYAKKWGWQLSLQGRKLYLVPRVISKWNAVEYVANILGVETVFTAGDSLLDYDLLRQGTHSIAPKHGEVCQYDSSLKISKEEGIIVAEQILDEVHVTLEKKLVDIN